MKYKETSNYMQRGLDRSYVRRMEEYFCRRDYQIGKLNAKKKERPTVLSRLRTADIFYEDPFHSTNTVGGSALPAEW